MATDSIPSAQLDRIARRRCFATVIGFFGAYALNRFKFPGKHLLSMMFIVPILVPPLILGVAFWGLLSLYNLQGHNPSVLICHVVILLPTAIALIALRLIRCQKTSNRPHGT